MTDSTRDAVGNASDGQQCRYCDAGAAFDVEQFQPGWQICHDVPHVAAKHVISQIPFAPYLLLDRANLFYGHADCNRAAGATFPIGANSINVAAVRERIDAYVSDPGVMGRTAWHIEADQLRLISMISTIVVMSDAS
jgi:hypothetical protein